MVNQQENYNLYTAINDLPDLVKGTVNLMESPQEKYMGLYATSVLTGALMPHVWTNYDGNVNYPALMLLVSFPPAAGKGKLALLPLVLKKINDGYETFFSCRDMFSLLYLYSEAILFSLQFFANIRSFEKK